MNVCITVVSHVIETEIQRAGKNTYADVIIEDGVWIGANSTIFPGVKIGRGSIIAAGSIVNKDVKPNTLVGGVPAREIKQIS